MFAFSPSYVSVFNARVLNWLANHPISKSKLYWDSDSD